MSVLKHEIPDSARSFLLQTHENMSYKGEKVDVVLEIAEPSPITKKEYILVEDVQKLIKQSINEPETITVGGVEIANPKYCKYKLGLRTVGAEIKSIPTINPESMVEEMIEDELMCECSITRVRTLEDVLGKIKGVPPDRMELS